MINKKRLTDTFVTLAEIDSPTGEEEKISRYVHGILGKKGVNCTRDSLNNVIAKIEGKGRPLLFSAHLDTVEPGRGVKAMIKNGAIISDGSTILGGDDKAGVGAIIESICVILEKKITTRPLDVVFTTSEEVGSYGAVGLDYTKLRAKEGYVFDMSRPIGLIVSGSPFYDRFDVEILGKAAHASLPEKGINTMRILKDVLDKIKLGKVSKNTIVNIGVIKGGSVRNTVPEHLELKGEVRSFSEVEQNTQLRKIREAFNESAIKYRGKVSVEIVRENSGYKYSADDPFIEKTKDIMERLEIKPVVKDEWGCSDVNILTEKGIKALNLSNGTRDAHTNNETVKVLDLVKLSELILSLSTN